MALVYAILCDGDDEKNFIRALNGTYETKCFFDYRIFLDEVRICKPNIIILDLYITLIQAEQLVIFLKHHHMYCDIPIIVISNRFIEKDYVRFLELGTDDYLRKPFLEAELLFKIKRILHHQVCWSVKIGDIFINQHERLVYVNDEQILLTFKEFQLLSYLCVRPNRIVTRKELEHNVWEDYVMDSRTLDMHIAMLRSKVFRKSLCNLNTITKIGYQLKS